MAYDGAQYSARVDGTTQRQLYTKVVDQVLNGVAYASRVISDGQPFEGKTEDITLDVQRDTQGQWFTGLETLNASATNTTVTTSFAHTAFTFPVVSIMLDSFANVGSLGIINIDTFKYEKAAAETLQQIGAAIFGMGAANQMQGLEGVVDDGTNVATIGGISRNTYTSLKATVTAAASNKLTLGQMATLHDSISAGGLTVETPNIGLTTKGIWSLYEQLLAPNVRASYDEVGYDRVQMKSKYGQRNSAELRNSAGFTALSYRDMHIIKDDMESVVGLTNLYFLNEDYMNWYGREEVPEEYKDIIEHVDFGSPEDYEGTGALALSMPSKYHGFYYQKPMLIPQQAGKISRFYVIGNFIGKSYRRQGKLTNITGV
jgi:hypothetical protein